MTTDPDRNARCFACGHLVSEECGCPCNRCPFCGVLDHGTGPAHREDCIRWAEAVTLPGYLT